MSYLKHSLPGISFAICIMLIGLYGIFQASDFNQNKNSEKDMKLVSSYEHHEVENNDSITIEYLPPIDTFPLAVQIQHLKKESNVPVIAKVLQMLSDGFDKYSPSHKDSAKTDAENKK